MNCGKKALITFALCVLSACSTARSENYAGQPIERVARDLGFPTRITDLPDGRRSFEWDITQTAQVGPIRPRLAGISLSTSGGAAVGVNLGRETVATGICTYTLTGTRVGETFIVEDFPVGNASCLS